MGLFWGVLASFEIVEFLFCLPYAFIIALNFDLYQTCLVPKVLVGVVRVSALSDHWSKMAEIQSGTLVSRKIKGLPTLSLSCIP